MDNLLEINSILNDRYRVDGLIGSGGMGHVYEGTHLLIGRKVAIKTLHKRASTEPSAVKRLYQEARIAGRIGNDNICEVTDMGVLDGDIPYLVMPLLIGGSLGQLLHATKILSLDRAIDIISQILSALAAAHANHIVHRDLKPDNVFVTRMGDRADFVKLLDFGISKIVCRSMTDELTNTGAPSPGTPSWMAPEQIESGKSIDHRVDLYAAGVILYMMLTGQKPFDAETYNELCAKIVSNAFPRPCVVNPDIPTSIEQIILKATAARPQQRYQSALEMRHALEAAMGRAGRFSSEAITDDTEQARSVDPSPTAVGRPLGRRRPDKQKRPMAAALVGIIIAAIAFFVGVSLDSPSAQEADGPDLHKTETSRQPTTAVATQETVLPGSVAPSSLKGAASLVTDAAQTSAASGVSQPNSAGRAALTRGRHGRSTRTTKRKATARFKAQPSTSAVFLGEKDSLFIGEYE